MPLEQDFPQAWKMGDAEPLRAMVRRILDTSGWVTRTDSKPLGIAGLLNQIVGHLVSYAATNNLDLASLKRSSLLFAENVVYLAACVGDQDDAALGPWAPGDDELTPRRSNWRTNAWPFWRASLAAACLHRLRQELKQWREQSAASDNQPFPKDCLHLALIWEILLPADLWRGGATQAIPPYWLPSTCIPSDTSAANDQEWSKLSGGTCDLASLPHAIRLVTLLDRLHPRSYGVWFPTVPVSLPSPTHPTPGYVLEAVVELYEGWTLGELAEGTNSSASVAHSSVLVAPWSLVFVTEATRQLLAGLFPHIRANLASSNEQSTEKDQVLIELSPVAGSPILTPAQDNVRLPIAIHGPSLTVSIALALWAAHESMVLYPLVATGEVRRNAIGPVADVPVKLDVIAATLKHVPGLRVLLSQHDFDHHTHSFTNVSHLASGLTVGTYASQLEVYRLPATLPELRNAKHTLLTDGFDDYRKYMTQSGIAEAMRLGISDTNEDRPGVYLKEDRDELDAAVDLASVVSHRLRFQGTRPNVEATSAHHVTVIPFDNEPLAALRHVVARLFSRTGQRPEQPVPVPLSLEILGGDSDDKSGMRDRWLDAIRKGLSDLQVNPEPTILQRPDVLRILLRSPDWSKFCFVAYAPNSRKNDFDQQTRAIHLLRAESTRRRKGNNTQVLPAILWVASDDHHARLINAEWTQKSTSSPISP